MLRLATLKVQEEYGKTCHHRQDSSEHVFLIDSCRSRISTALRTAFISAVVCFMSKAEHQESSI